MQEITLQEIKTVIQKRYKSLESPDFSFTRNRQVSKNHKCILKELERNYQVEDVTDLNCDVCSRFVLTKEKRAWVLELSMVGPYAILLDMDKTHSPILNFSSERNTKEVCELLIDYNLFFLEECMLKEPIPLKLDYCEPESVRIYQALFSDVEVMPGERMPDKMRQTMDKAGVRRL